jgi:hypothetical protein
MSLTIRANAFPIEDDVVILGDSLIAGGHAYRLSATSPTIIRAFSVDIRDVAHSYGRDVIVLANQIAFSTSSATIDTTGYSAPNQWLPGNKPLISGTLGTDGITGLDGPPGFSAGNVVLYAQKITGTLRVIAMGGKGGRGQDGGDGSPGAPYNGPINYAPNLPDCHGSEACPVPAGPPGGRGGRGGTPGKPGTSGRGGNLDVWVPKDHPSIPVLLNLSGGPPADPANPGNPGQGGRGGQYKRARLLPGFRRPGIRINPPPRRIDVLGPNGDSPTGFSAVPQPVTPQAGATGFYNGLPPNVQPPGLPHEFQDAEIGRNCSPIQLWRILQAAEQRYINDDFQFAAPRLIWVATMASILGRQG